MKRRVAGHKHDDSDLGSGSTGGKLGTKITSARRSVSL
jgi:hypothetical protein